ncbi:MAG: hypothetical protein HYX24_00580 [Candidatus Aenigmarchaeota archaeon]|nr:hypothetical protein [Candidatus Aenigmarchaeota archaeon]
MEAELFFIFILFILALIAGYFIGRKVMEARFESWFFQRERGIRQDAARRSRSVLGGLFSEQLAPYLPGFKHDPTEARFLGSPIDFLVFKGLASGEPEEVVFVEVKKGSSSLSPIERRLKQVIEKRKVRWEEVRVD